jgi:citrate/tricarballylate utilization protein
MRKAEHEMVVCNACRYCEAYCPVFQAMEQRVTFQSADLTYLANLCHNCGDATVLPVNMRRRTSSTSTCRALVHVRVASYESFAWPCLRVAFRRPWVTTSLRSWTSSA